MAFRRPYSGLAACRSCLLHAFDCPPPPPLPLPLPPPPSPSGLRVHPAAPVLLPPGGARCPPHPRLQQQEAGGQAPPPHDLRLALSPAQTMCGKSTATPRTSVCVETSHLFCGILLETGSRTGSWAMTAIVCSVLTGNLLICLIRVPECDCK